ncbi:MAG: carboxynorspermidine decarboxylase [Bacteroidaceae bacterium]|nr:carboxynorspermidine decarboxylase [Bacteroidales bacterium]MBQ3188976.1 carboxynorspermidine decarboxylase [Bacteroidaceae bacterium]MBQ3622124.1 carboxynorspermidine decarboxylase [Bacteroidaceae bacterium]
MQVPSPCYVMEEQLLRRNLQLISRVAREANVEIILAFKAFALWKTFPIFREYINSVTASSVNEARLAFEEFGSPAHTFSPAYTMEEFGAYMRCSSHITFNSLTQYERFAKLAAENKISCGIRINPEYSEIETELYNPCAPGSRFGVTCDQLPDVLPEHIEGFHCHCHCESDSYALEHTLEHIEQRFGRWLPQLKWLNLGGGHLMTRADYDVNHLIALLNGLHERYPNLHIILEPGSAFAWQTGSLVASVVDIVENRGIRTAILDVSFTCHMPDCLEMPYQPKVTDAESMEPDAVKNAPHEQNIYRLGGNSCLSGDYMGSWRFPAPLKIGDRVVFEDMIHYTTVKTNMFNGISHPSIALLRQDGTLDVMRQFTYEDYRDRMC